MMTIRRSADRGHFDHGWLDTHHTFSFADYYDPAHRGFRSLRVINEDWVQPGQGFGMHPHRDMEIITVVVSGELEHKDSLGNGAVIRPGEVQVMTAGRGIVHSEFNPSPTTPVHLLQIWIRPDRANLDPGWSQRDFSTKESRDQWKLVVSSDARMGSLSIHQDASIYVGSFGEGKAASHSLAPGRHAWLQLVSGEASVNGQALKPGDGAAFSDEAAIDFRALSPTQAILFDLA